MRRRDLRAAVFGRLTVTEKVESLRGQAGGVYGRWLCKCECGGEIVVLTCNLTRGRVQSCGCLREERGSATIRDIQKLQHLPPGESGFTAAYHSYKLGARKRGYVFELSKDEVRELFRADCYYCGQPPSNVRKVPWTTAQFIYNGIDRVNNALGYVRDNVVPCCSKCNYAKGTSTQAEFLSWVSRIKEKLLESADKGGSSRPGSLSDYRSGAA